MSEPEQISYGTVEIMDFTIPTDVVVSVRNDLPAVPVVYSIGCGVPAREPREVATLLGRNIDYIGLDSDPSKISRAKRFADTDWRSKRSQHAISAGFIHVDLTQNLDSEHIEKADILVLNHPDVLGSEESLLSGEPSGNWERIVQNGLRCLGKGGTVILTCYSKEELDLLESYLEQSGLKITHKQVNEQAQLSENYAIIFANSKQ